jgi:hypothetical protein
MARARRHSVHAEPKEIGTIGDVNFPEYDGGPVFDNGDGTFSLEYVETPENQDSPNARWTVYRVTLDPDVPDWIDLKSVARTTDQDPEELRVAFEKGGPMDLAYAYESVAGYYGWHELDQYPLELTKLEIEERYEVDMGGRSGIVDALEEEVQRMADESSATGWSSIGDQLASDLDEEGFDPESIVNMAFFGDAVAVNGDALVDPEWEQNLGLRRGKHPQLWSEVGTGRLQNWLENNGYELTNKGGSIPSDEGYAYGEHVIDAVAERLKIPDKIVESIAETLDWWQEEIPSSTSGDGEIWAKPKG